MNPDQPANQFPKTEYVRDQRLQLENAGRDEIIDAYVETHKDQPPRRLQTPPLNRGARTPNSRRSSAPKLEARLTSLVEVISDSVTEMRRSISEIKDIVKGFANLKIKEAGKGAERVRNVFGFSCLKKKGKAKTKDKLKAAKKKPVM